MPTFPAIPQSLFEATLLPASFGGVPFAVLGSQNSRGRRQEEHEYPFRDIPYAEDLGRRARRITVNGFLIGDDVAAQTAALLAQCEVQGAQLLVHPTLGMALWACDTVETDERWDRGRYVEFHLNLIEPGQVLYPTNASDTQSATQSAADNAGAAATSDFLSATFQSNPTPLT